MLASVLSPLGTVMSLTKKTWYISFIHQLIIVLLALS